MPRTRSTENNLVVSAAKPVRRKATTKRAKVAAPAVETPAQSTLPQAADTISPVAACKPSQDAIARLAYSYWEARGYAGGSPEEDWLRAERELTAK
jgi:hypothetical protein